MFSPDEIATTVATTSLDSGSSSSVSPKENTVDINDFAYRAACIFDAMVTEPAQRAFSARIAQAYANAPAAIEAALTTVQREDRCSKCNGTGVYVGQGTTTCYPCAGKGFLTTADNRRNWGYNRWAENQMAASIKAEIAAAQDLPIDGPTLADEALADWHPCGNCGPDASHEIRNCASLND